MATRTPQGGTDGGIGRPGIGMRAVDAALAAPQPFATRAGGHAERTSAKLIDRWAPEDDGDRRSRPLRSLAFADRLLAPYIHAASGGGSVSFDPGGMIAGVSRRTALPPAAASWVFPVPWYQDELAWLAAARAGESQLPRTATPMAVEYIAPSMAQHIAAPSFVGGNDVALSVAGWVPPPAVAAPTTPNERVAAATHMPLRAWSPLVPFKAAQAAELMAGVLARAPETMLRGGHQVPASVPVMEVVAPRDLAGPERQAAPQLSPQARARLVEAVRIQSEERSRAQQVPAPALATEAPSAPIGLPAAIETGTPEPLAAEPVAALPAAARAEELLAASLLSDRPTVAPSAGPRVAMPAGLGGLVTGLRAAELVDRPLRSYAPSIVAAAPAGAPTVAAATMPTTDGAARALRTAAAAPALSPLVVRAEPAWESMASSRPAALAHVGWADRWLARFAGASPEALATMDAAATTGQVPNLRALVAAAPGAIYLQSPAEPVLGRAASAAARGPGVEPQPLAAGVVTPPRAGALVLPPALRIADDAASVPDEVFAAIMAAAADVRAGGAERSRVDRAPLAPEPPPPRVSPSAADRILQVPPVVPGAGLRPQLASSPLAPALAGILDLPATPTFDVRAVTPPAAAASYLAGLTRQVVVRGLEGAHHLIGPLAVLGGTVLPLPAGVEPTHPSVLRLLASQAPIPELVAPWGDDQPAAADAPAGGPAALVRAAAQPLTLAAALSAAASPAVLSTELAAAPAMPAAAPARGSFADLAPLPAMTMPTSADLNDGWGARPGQTAQLAEAWSVEHEQAAADLSLDFVTPELLLAARVYGFAPAQAARAARLAVSGRAGLAALAAGVDLTFTDAMTGGSAATVHARALAIGGGSAPAQAAPAPAGRAPVAHYLDLGGAPAAVTAAAGQAPAWSPTTLPSAAAPRLPRGAFLWPESATTALGIRAERSNEAQPNSLAALDLLAAYVVAQAGVDAVTTHTDVTETADQPGQAEAAGARAFAPPAGRPLPAEFETIYLALARSPAGQSLSPAVRAARALAIAEEASTSPGSARARAAAAWAVMPVVMGAEVPWSAAADRAAPETADGQTEVPPRFRGALAGTARAGESLRSLVAPGEVRADRAGDDAPVHATAFERAPLTELVQQGASADETARAMAAQARVNSNQIGGDLPAWFESAARRLLDEQGGSGDGMTMAEMVLVTAAPARQVAAAPRSADAPPTQAAPSPSGETEKPEIESLAQKVYAEVCRLIEIARERSGDPWLS